MNKKMKSYFIIAVFIFIYCANIQLKIPGPSIALPAYDLFFVLIALLYLAKTNFHLKISACVRPYINTISIGLLALFFLTMASIIIGGVIYSDEILLTDINCTLIYPRLIFYSVIGGMLSLYIAKYKFFSYKVFNFIIIMGMSYICLICILQYAEYQSIHIPLLGQFALRYLPARWRWIRVVGTAANPNWNSFDLNIINSAIFSMLIIAIGKKKFFRLFPIIAFNAILFFLILVTLSRTGIISYFLILFLFILFILKKQKAAFIKIKTKIISVFAITLVLVTVITIGIKIYKKYENVFQRRIEATLKINEFGQRAFLWTHRYETAMERFPLGIGPSKATLETIVDSEFVSTVGNAGVFGLFIYTIVILFLIFKPLSLAWKKLPSEIYAMLFFAVALGVLSLCYSLTADFARNLRSSSLIFTLHSFFFCRIVLFLKNENRPSIKNRCFK